MLIRINDELNEEQLDVAQKILGPWIGELKGHEIEIEDENIVNELEHWGIAEVIEQGKDNETLNQAPDFKKVEEKEIDKSQPEEEDKQTSEQDKNDEEKENEEKQEEESEKEEKPLTLEQKKEAEDLRHRVVALLPYLDCYRRLSPQAQSIVINSYNKETPESYYRHFKDNNFLNNVVVEEPGTSNKINLADVHSMVRGTIAIQDSINKNSQEEQMQEPATSTDISNEGRTATVKVPEVLNDVSKDEKEKTQEELKFRIKQMIYAAVYSNDRPDKVLIELRDIGARVGQLQKDLAEDIGAGDEGKIKYMEEIPSAELMGIIEGAKQTTDNIQLNLDWSNPVAIEKSTELLKQVAAESNQPISNYIDNVNVKIVVENTEDINQAKLHKDELEKLGIKVDSEIEAKNNELEEEAEKELASPEEKVMNGVKEIAGAAITVAAGIALGEEVSSIIDGKEHNREEE